MSKAKWVLPQYIALRHSSALISDVQNNIVMQLVMFFESKLNNWMFIAQGRDFESLNLPELFLYLVRRISHELCLQRADNVGDVVWSHCIADALLITISKWHKLIGNKHSWSPLTKMLLKHSEEQGENLFLYYAFIFCFSISHSRA